MQNNEIRIRDAAGMKLPVTMCHLIITCQKKSLYPDAQHNIFELALTSHDEDSRHIVGEFTLQAIKYITKQTRARIETKIRMRQT
jgi:hypothetical protein